MTAPEARSSSDPPPEQAFNFGVMTNHQVMLLGRSVMLGMEHELDEGRETIEEVEPVLRLYVGGMMALLKSDPDRAKDILRRQALSDDQWDELTAVRCTPAVATYDFGLARDILVHADGSTSEEGIVSDSAVDAEIEIASTATPEQVADLNAAIEAARQAPGQLTPPGLTG